MAMPRFRETVPALDPHASLALMHFSTWLNQNRSTSFSYPADFSPGTAADGAAISEPLFALPYEKRPRGA